MMEKIAITCSGCQAKYKVTVQGEVNEKISFSCRKCGQMLQFDPSQPKPQEPTTELLRVVCKNCKTEFVKNIEDDSELCYQCRIDLLLKKKKESQDGARAEAKPVPAEPEKSASRYTFRNSDGLVLGPIKLRTVAVLVREKRINGSEEVSKDGQAFRPLPDFPELIEFFPELGQKSPSVVAETQIPLEDENSRPPGEKADEAGSKIVEPEPKLYYLKLNGTREFGPVRKSTVMDLIECKFLSAQDLISRDHKAWSALSQDEEFKEFVPSEEGEVVELVETVEG